VNPVEHSWEELREKYVHNRLFSSLDPLVEVLCHGLNELTEDKERPGSIQSGIAELQSLAAGILRDFDAVRAALTLPYSNDHVA
jgi:hypothetical protein